MPLTAAQVATKLAWPFSIVKASRSKTPTTNGLGVTFTPALIAKQTYTAPSTIDTDGISASHAGAAVAGTTSMTIGGALATGGVAALTPPRNVVITVTHGSAVVAMNGTISGTDEYGKVITEDWSVTAGTTSKTFTGKKAFKTVTGITETIAADASANTIIAGDGKVLGVSFKTTGIKPIVELEDGATPTAGVTVAGSTAATADARGTYTPNSTLNGALTFVIYYIVDDPTDIT